VLKELYSRIKLVNEGKPLVEGGSSYMASEMLSASTLDNQQGLFKLTMKANCEAACAPPFHINPLIKLWCTLLQSKHLYKLIFEYFNCLRLDVA
jgi:hypothetical protein